MSAGGNLLKLDGAAECLSTRDAGPEYYDHIRKINDIFYDQIKMSDQKAAYIFTFMFAFLISSQEGRGVFTWHRYVGGESLPMVLSAVLALASIVTIISAILVVLPRKSATSTTLFWGAWPAHRAGFLEAAGGGDRSYLLRQYVENADVLSAIACSKYRCVAFAFRALLVTVICYVCLLAVN
ncbi:Pycsar system effector family protein [Sinorhizobium alkalisoli]|uniref:Pycsar effector protein domain-containing protein n=1 Tax=Sinorhizobium alkalisoli TaxID=1752398 RepID=A0A1E3V773_9HYPH|nr:Pycsar system effector family protein [Sinorhizobium alkalisoli]MCA1493491.1 hypothetical protein [Ensifer sp. NBAIM29]MCG5479515.1 hypothetical protein [Sinorhizobium alkalisoli]ODR88666.1 hypothetical protein A8M32_24660 [Sinorhizobium alkalisoli]